MNIELLPLATDSAYLEDAVAIYAEYIGDAPHHHSAFFHSHTKRAGYCGFVARVDERIVGVAFGSCSVVGQWWHDKVAQHVGKLHPALQEAWVLTQLNVLAAYRNQHIGTMLHNQILTKQPSRNVLLSTPVANVAAHRFYKRHGWHVLHGGFSFLAGDEPYAIFHKIITHTPESA